MGCLWPLQQGHLAAAQEGVGGTILWAGNGEAWAYGDANVPKWDFAVLVRYPSRAAFLRMVTSPEYAVANVHREHGVVDHVILAATETYSKFPPLASG